MGVSEQAEWRPEATDYVISLARMPREKLIREEAEGKESCVLCGATTSHPPLEAEDHRRYCPWLIATQWVVVTGIETSHGHDARELFLE